MSTVTTHLNHGITFGTSGYVSPLTITSTGVVNNNGSGRAIFGGTETVVNDGQIIATGSAPGAGYGYAGVYLFSGYVNNHGTITSSTGNAVLLQTTGTVVNSGFIYGGRWGITSRGLTTVTNTGTISAASQGIVLEAGGIVTNTNLITGAQGVGISGGIGTVDNSGTITSYNPAVGITGGSVSNASTGLISVDGLYAAVAVSSAAGSVTNAGTMSGYIGVQFGNYNNTLIDTGTIIGNDAPNGGAVLFGSGNDLLRFDPSASVTIQGLVDGGGGTNTLDFASGAGTLTGRAADFTNFTQGSIASGAQWTFDGNVTLGTGIDLTALGALTVAGTVANYGTISSTNYGIQLGGGTIFDSGVIAGTKPISFGTGDNLLVVEASGTAITGTIAGFTGPHDAIDLTSLSDIDNNATTSFDTLTNVLTVTGDNGSVQLHLGNQNYTGVVWQATNDGSNGTEVTPLCFRTGTAIATPDGEQPVEHLKPGDLVLTAGGQARPVVWIGTGRVLATRGRRTAATPVIVRKDALAPNVPNRDLHVTRAHALYIDKVLIPVEFLVNHRTIVWDDRAQEVELYHVELESHDVLIANGAPAETYRDDGNRWLFHNANSGWHLPPQPPCAPVLTGGPIVDAAWRRLLDRAGPRDTFSLTNDPDLHLIVNGTRVNAQGKRNGAYIFRLPSAPTSVTVASRSGIPSELGIARDPRPLGVALRRVEICQSWKFMFLDADDDRLTAGFHDYEPSNRLRWTDGHAHLPIEAFAQFDSGAEVILYLTGATQYHRPGRAAA
ncbi:Hint domain-containing protein [Acidisphaera sp. S103]|uniref:Hint domain-containing protein n=1 Tax=Acidisphaera sp. S103 TaxID=1747223 RepID=UPI00131CD1E2|nr:Hint domain-containing protein [Acidisphaera sp. S103]